MPRAKALYWSHNAGSESRGKYPSAQDLNNELVLMIEEGDEASSQGHFDLAGWEYETGLDNGSFRRVARDM